MGLRRSWLRRLEKRAGHNSFVLRDGTTYRYDFAEAAGDLFVYCVESWAAEDPSEASLEAPPILQAIRAARDSEAAMEPFRPDKGTEAGAFLDPLVLIHDHDESDKEA
jgi:hypothetical protein